MPLLVSHPPPACLYSTSLFGDCHYYCACTLSPLLHVSLTVRGILCRAELCTERFYAIIPTLFLYSLLICYPYILLNFLWLFTLVNILHLMYCDILMYCNTSKYSKRNVGKRSLLLGQPL